MLDVAMPPWTFTLPMQAAPTAPQTSIWHYVMQGVIIAVFIVVFRGVIDLIALLVRRARARRLN